MKSWVPLAGALIVGLSAAADAQGVPASVHFVPHDKVAATFTKGGPLVEDPGLAILAQHRGAGGAEWHEHTNHIFMVMAGEATLVIGGMLVDAVQSAPGQMRGKGIEGGETHHLTKGDVVTIPAKTPHWWKEVPTKTIDLYTVNIESER